MLIEFSVENFTSYKEIQTLSLQATKQKEPENTLFQRLFTVNQNFSLLKSKAIFGGNASGKSNLIYAMASFWKIIKNNLQTDKVLNRHIVPHRLDESSFTQPSYFQIVLLIDGIQYRYGFEADINKIHSEWLFVKRKSEVPYFIREDIEIKSYNQNSFSEIKEVINKNNRLYKKNTLIISVLNALNAPISTLLYNGIIKDISINSHDTFSENFWKNLSVSNFKTDNNYKDFAESFLKSIDDTITGFDIKEIELEVPDTNFKEKLDYPVTIRRVGNKNILFNLDQEEAKGTKKIFAISHALYKALYFGKTYIIDEFDAYLHPELTRMIIGLFHSKKVHPHAQLVFVSHDTNLLDSSFLRRDQITFIEKSQNGNSECFDLSDIRGVRENDLFEKNYLKGKYGGLPYLRDLENILTNG